MKRIIAVCLSVVLLLGSVSVTYAGELPKETPALELSAEEMPTGLMPAKGHRVSSAEISRVGIFSEKSLPGGFKKKQRTLYSAQYAHGWDTYSTNYFYNKLNSREKEFWDYLDLVCLYYLLYAENSLDGTDYIRADGLSQQQMINVAALFRLSNPQYYFLDNSYSYGTDTSSGSWCYAYGIYDSMENGAARQAATGRMQTQINTWVSAVNACASYGDKVKKIHDLICNKVVYDWDAFNDMKNLEQSHYTQSAYSAICMNQTVCAGYSQAFSLLSNAVGIDAISVTSEDHQWNKVKLNDRWYNIDLTWDDQESGIIYKYFLRGDAFWDSEGDASHTEEPLFNGLLPNCTADTNGTTNIPPSSGRAVKPAISYAPYQDYYAVTISNIQPGATVYFTVDGSTPSSAYSRGYRYGGSFGVDCGVQVKAVAVMDGYADSEVAFCTIPSTPKLAEPSIKSIANATNGVQLKWNGVSGATGYRIYRKTGNGSWTSLGTTTATNYTDKKASSGKTYSYTVQSYANNLKSKYGGTSRSIKYLSYGKIKSVSNVEKGIQLKWSKVSGASGYEIWRKQGSGKYAKISTIKKGSTVSYTDTKVKKKAGKSYAYKVIPYSGKTKGAYKAQSLIRLMTPTLSSAKNTAKNTVTLKWKKASGAKGYYVYRKTGKSSWKKIATVKGASKVTYRDKKAKRGKTYTYSIKSYNGKSTSSYAKKSIKIKANR